MGCAALLDDRQGRKAEISACATGSLIKHVGARRIDKLSERLARQFLDAVAPESFSRPIGFDDLAAVIFDNEPRPRRHSPIFWNSRLTISQHAP